MKKLLITYNMENDFEDMETCIVLSMADEVAGDILKNGWESSYLEGIGADGSEGEIHRILRAASTIQGCEYAGFCTAEEVEI